MSDLAARAAVQVDRLVLGVNRQVGPRHGEWLMTIARDLGLDSLKLIPHLGEFWLQVPVSIELAEARLPYAEAGSVAARITEFEALGLLISTDSGHVATERFRRLLRASIVAREEVVVRTWSGLEDLVSEADPLVTRVAGSSSDDHLVACAHRALEPSADPLHRFYGRLVTLRYIRQHDHVSSWREQGFDAQAAMAMTALWQGDEVDPDARGLHALERAGLASDMMLTPGGRKIREGIEANTNLRVGASWVVLDDGERRRLNDVLAILPASPS